MSRQSLENALRSNAGVWKWTRAKQARFLIDGHDYFSALVAELARAEHQILIAGWDVHTQIPLSPTANGPSATLEDVLEDVLQAHAEVRVYILVWDAPWPLRIARQWFAGLRLKYRFGDRVRYRRDPARSFGQSHHQKCVVIDDAIAFVGGLDLTSGRWDERRHREGHELRQDPWGDEYDPWHDVQSVFSGVAAAEIGALLRQRWEKAQIARGLDDRDIDRIAPISEPPIRRLADWSLDATELEEVPMAIARTQIDDGSEDTIREIESLYKAVIASARNWIYLENQYFASEVVTEWIEARLDEEDGPEIILISPAEAEDALDSAVMGTKRAMLVDRLRQHRNAARFGAFCPIADGEGRKPVFVHAKVVIADLDYVQIGSANIANRSFRLDTECDVGFLYGEASASLGPHLLYRLLGEHLDADPETVRARIEATGSVLGTIEALQSEPQNLAPLVAELDENDWDPDVVGSLDPENPKEPRKVLRRMLRTRPELRRRVITVAVVVAMLLATVAGSAIWAIWALLRS